MGVQLKIWKPPRKSHKINVKILKRYLSFIPENFTITIDDMDFLCTEIDWEDEKIDFFKAYGD